MVRAGAALVAACIVIGISVMMFGTPSFDVRVVAEASQLNDGAVGRAAQVASLVGYTRGMVLLTALGAAVLALALGRRQDAGVLVLAMVVATACMFGLKELFARARPDPLYHGYSMPSGHATASAAFSASMMLVAQTRRSRLVVWPLAAMFAVAMAAARLVLGVHYPTDVLAGACLGVGVALLAAGMRPSRRAVH